MSTLDFVDLRAPGDRTYNQNPTNSCYAHAPAHALEVLLRRAGKPAEVSRAWIYWFGRLNQGRPYENVGLSYDDMKVALEKKGVVWESDFPWSKNGTKPPDMPSRLGPITFLPTPGSIENIERKLCLGIPVIFGFAFNESYFAIGGNKWQTDHWWKPGQMLGGHGVCILGYDKKAQVFLCKNNLGPTWGDEGCFGFRYDDFKRLQMGTWSIDHIEGLSLNPVEGYMTVPYLLDYTDTGFFTSQNKESLKQEALDELAKGPQSLVDWCKRRKVRDKHLEHIFGAHRGFVRDFKLANPGLDWEGFYWAEK